MNCLKKKYSKRLLYGVLLQLFSVYLILFCTDAVCGDWQTILEQNFDYTESFDQLSDWKGSNPGDIIKSEYPNDFPVRSDGDPLSNHPNAINWNYYKYSESANDKFPLNDYAIKNHGSDWVWQGSGKSLVIDYGQGDFQTDKGPGKFAFKIGNSPADGYESECYVFWMQRFPADFFTRETDSFTYFGFLKIFTLSSGFKHPRQWGTDAENAELGRTECIDTHDQTAYTYGANGFVMNYQSRSGSLTGTLSNHWIAQEGDRTYCRYAKEGFANNDTAGMSDLIWNNEWFGIEVRYKLSSPHGASNGQVEVWIYDDEGNNIADGHVLFDNLVTIADGTTAFDHKINKFNWGINRSGAPTYKDFKGAVEYFYIDDIVIDSERIGEKYFSLLKNNRVGPPINFIIETKN